MNILTLLEKLTPLGSPKANIELCTESDRQEPEEAESGLTLLEVLMAILVISVVIGLIAPSLVLTVGTRVQNRRVQEAVGLAQQEIENIRVLLNNGQFTDLTDPNLPPEAEAVDVDGGGSTPITDEEVLSVMAANALCTGYPTCTISDALELEQVSDNYLLQAFRGEAEIDGTEILGFRMGVRVYSTVFLEADTFPAGVTLDTQPVDVNLTSSINRTAPLAVFFSDLYKGDTESSFLALGGTGGLTSGSSTSSSSSSSSGSASGSASGSSSSSSSTSGSTSGSSSSSSSTSGSTSGSSSSSSSTSGSTSGSSSSSSGSSSSSSSTSGSTSGSASSSGSASGSSTGGGGNALSPFSVSVSATCDDTTEPVPVGIDCGSPDNSANHRVFFDLNWGDAAAGSSEVYSVLGCLTADPFCAPVALADVTLASPGQGNQGGVAADLGTLTPTDNPSADPNLNFSPSPPDPSLPENLNQLAATTEFFIIDPSAINSFCFVVRAALSGDTLASNTACVEAPILEPSFNLDVQISGASSPFTFTLDWEDADPTGTLETYSIFSCFTLDSGCSPRALAGGSSTTGGNEGNFAADITTNAAVFPPGMLPEDEPASSFTPGSDIQTDVTVNSGPGVTFCFQIEALTDTGTQISNIFCQTTP